MSEFSVALSYILDIRSEGKGYSDRPDDLGGPTNSGISLRFLKTINQLATAETIKNLQSDEIENIYQRYFWNKMLSQINNQNVANYIFDFLVNANPHVAYQMAQRALWSLLPDRSLIKDDGVLGSITLDQINHAGSLLLPPMRAERANYYREIAAKNPDQIANLEGWLNRTYRNV